MQARIEAAHDGVSFFPTPGRSVRGQAPSLMGDIAVRNFDPVESGRLRNEAYETQHLALPKAYCLPIKNRKHLKNGGFE